LTFCVLFSFQRTFSSLKSDFYNISLRFIHVNNLFQFISDCLALSDEY